MSTSHTEITPGVGTLVNSEIFSAISRVIGFSVRPTPAARELATREGVDIRLYSVIYQVVEDIEKALKGMLAPEFEERALGTAEVRQTFRVPRIG